MRIVIIDYGAGNIHSVLKSFQKTAEKHSVKVTSETKEIISADYIVLPGVGAFKDCMKGLEQCAGLKEALYQAVMIKHKPFMGICVGMQLLAEYGFEHGKCRGLGYIKGNIRRIDGDNLKIPHMGWNELHIKRNHPVFASLAKEKKDVYFVHSYHLCDYEENDILAVTEYGGRNIVAAVGRDNFIGLQFHPEKSQNVGLKIIADFINWKP